MWLILSLLGHNHLPIYQGRFCRLLPLHVKISAHHCNFICYFSETYNTNRKHASSVNGMHDLQKLTALFYPRWTLFHLAQFSPVFVTCWAQWKPYLWSSRRHHRNQVKRDSICSTSASLTMPSVLHHFLTTIFSVLIASQHHPFHSSIF